MIKAEYTCPDCGEKFLSELELNKHKQGVCTKGEGKNPSTSSDKTTVDRVEDAVKQAHEGYEQSGHSDLERTH